MRPFYFDFPAADSLTGVLLDTTVGRQFLELMSPDNLMRGVEIMVAMIAIVVILIYATLFTKKNAFFYTSRIRNNIEVWISHIILEESLEGLVIPRKFRNLLKNPEARQLAINELVNCKKNFSGTVAENIVKLYLELGLREDSVRKMKNIRRWYLQAKGIQELYLMDQHDMLKRIYKHTNSRNPFVRSEAQTGVIYLTGFDGLRFLDVVSYPISLWHQIKLLEQLKLFGKKEDLSDRIPNWLKSPNDTVVIFALQLAAEYQQFSIRDHVAGCMVHPNKEVRTQAIRTLVRLADENTPRLLAGYFHKEHFDNQVIILDAFAGLATDEQEDFLVRLLDAADNIIRLKAAKVLVQNCANGRAILERRSERDPEPFERILRHINSDR
ncbi:MAG: hypothetical protein GXC72_02770 [Chitinophagaceae bacterium]|jgi:hypothetical protein|nr:hypothetical protein [Chitinophagaceae bacterium]